MGNEPESAAGGLLPRFPGGIPGAGRADRESAAGGRPPLTRAKWATVAQVVAIAAGLLAMASYVHAGAAEPFDDDGSDVTVFRAMYGYDAPESYFDE